MLIKSEMFGTAANSSDFVSVTVHSFSSDFILPIEHVSGNSNNVSLFMAFSLGDSLS